jgi:hypothetical protein
LIKISFIGVRVFTLFYYCLLLRELSYSIVWWGIGKLFQRKKTIIYLVHNISFWTLSIYIAKPRHVDSKLLTDYSTIYCKGGKSYKKYIKITQENLFSPHRKSFQTGKVPVARYSQLLPRLSINCSKIVNTNHPIKIKHFHMLWWSAE